MNNYIPTCEAQLKTAKNDQATAQQAVTTATNAKAAADKAAKDASDALDDALNHAGDLEQLNQAQLEANKVFADASSKYQA